ncbi:MAG: hypothetical protein K9K80_00520 [Spirochaetia bacterium]|nr:hypothetical protein [Spirochaetia bacterium]
MAATRGGVFPFRSLLSLGSGNFSLLPLLSLRLGMKPKGNTANPKSLNFIFAGNRIKKMASHVMTRLSAGFSAHFTCLLLNIASKLFSFS